MADHVYVLFFTNLLTEVEVVSGRGYVPSIFNLIFDGHSNMLQQCTNYIIPPFTHCKIAFVSKDRMCGFDMYSITGNGNLEYEEGKTYIDVVGACVLKLQLNDLQMKLLKSMLNVFVIHKERYAFSYWKCTLIGARMRNLLCMGPHAYPDIDTLYWTCSEFVTYCLQQAGVIDSQSLHPSYVAPTHLFLELIANPHCDILNSYDPMYRMIGNKKKSGFKSEDDTNAYKVFCKIMNIHDVKDVLKYRNSTLGSSLCRRMRIRVGDISQYGVINTMTTPNFSVGDYITKKNEDLDVVATICTQGGSVDIEEGVGVGHWRLDQLNNMHVQKHPSNVHTFKPLYSNYSAGYNKTNVPMYG